MLDGTTLYEGVGYDAVGEYRYPNTIIINIGLCDATTELIQSVLYHELAHLIQIKSLALAGLVIIDKNN